VSWRSGRLRKEGWSVEVESKKGGRPGSLGHGGGGELQGGDAQSTWKARHDGRCPESIMT